MQDQLTILWQYLQPRLRIVMLLLFAALLAFVAYLQMSEVVDRGGAEVPSAKLTQLKGDNKSAQALRAELFTPPKPLEKSPFAPLVVENIFSIKTVMDEAEKEKAANDLYQEAVALAGQGRYAQALEKCDAALAQRSSFLDAIALKKEMQSKLSAPAATPGPAAAPPVPGQP